MTAHCSESLEVWWQRQCLISYLLWLAECVLCIGTARLRWCVHCAGIKLTLCAQCAFPLVDNKSGGTHLDACRRSCRSLTRDDLEDDEGPEEHNPFFDESGWLSHSGQGKSLRFLLPGSEGEWVCALTFFILHRSLHSCHRPGDGPIPEKMVLVEGSGQPFAVRHMQSCGSKSAAHPPISVCVNLMLDGPNHMSRGVIWLGNDQQQLLPLL
jgi:hypothetical protein